MQILPSAYASPNVSEIRKNNLDKTGATVPDLFKDTISTQVQTPVANAVTGMTTSNIADDTIGPVVQQSQKTNEVVMGDTTWFEKQNFISESDRKLLGAMTGYTVDEIGRFTDKNGNRASAPDLTHHSFRDFMMGLSSERRYGNISGKDITAREFKGLIDQARASVSSLGEQFNENLLVKGLAYIEGRGKA